MPTQDKNSCHIRSAG